MPLSQGITLAHMAARSSCPPASPSGASVCQRFVSLSSRSQVSSPCATTPPPFFGAPALSSPARPSRGGPVRDQGWQRAALPTQCPARNSTRRVADRLSGAPAAPGIEPRRLTPPRGDPLPDSTGKP